MKPGPNLKFGSMIFLTVFVVAAVGLYGLAQLVDVQKTVTAAEGEGEVGGPVNITIVGKELKFDRRTFTAGQGVQVTVTFDNQDAGVLHNIAFYTNRSATTKIPDATSSTFPGVMQEVLRFTAPGVPGNNFYRCDVHPDTMTGTMVVR